MSSSQSGSNQPSSNPSSSSQKGSPTARQVSFSIFSGHTKLVEGNFTVMDKPGVSCFGATRDIVIESRKERISIYQGAVFEHELNPDGSASISLKYYSAEPTDDTPIGYRQLVLVKAGLSMGSESGNGKLESVMLGNEHEFVFRSHTLS
jgi:hypothetical protein